MDETTATVPEVTQEPTVPQVGDLVIADVEETVAMTTEPVYLGVIQSAAADVAHTNLFGSFLICGTLIGIAILRGRYGT